MVSERAVLYARVSGNDYNDEMSKRGDQLTMCREYAEKKGYTILHKFQEDTYSKRSDENLPYLNKAFDLARDGAVDVLICRDLDRMGDLEKLVLVNKNRAPTDVEVEYVLKKYENTPEGDLMKYFRGSVSTYEWRKIAQRTRRGKRNSVKARNVTYCGAPPYGYREATVDDKRTLVVDEEEAEVVRTIYRLYLGGNGNGNKFGFIRIAKHLTERQIPTRADKLRTINDKYKTGHGYWYETVVKRMTASPVYKGEWQYGKHTDNPITIPVPRIISDEDWEAAQVIRKKNRRVGTQVFWQLRPLASGRCLLLFVR